MGRKFDAITFLDRIIKLYPEIPFSQNEAKNYNSILILPRLSQISS